MPHLFPVAHQLAVAVKESGQVADAQAELEPAVLKLVLEVREQQVVKAPHAVHDFGVGKEQVNEACKRAEDARPRAEGGWGLR